MSSLPVTVDPLAVDVSFTVHQLRVVLADGQEILVPYFGFPDYNGRPMISERPGGLSAEG